MLEQSRPSLACRTVRHQLLAYKAGVAQSGFISQQATRAAVDAFPSVLMFVFASSLLSVCCASGFAEHIPLRERQEQLAASLRKVSPALVCVQDRTGAGSGVVVSADGLILTASHVVETRGRRNASLVVQFPGGEKYRVKILGMNRFTDAAMLKITEPCRHADQFPHVKTGRSHELARGDWCFALGHPGGFQKERPAPVRLGRILSVGHRTVVSDCAIVLGDSGGPLFDLTGKLIGIHSMITEIIVENRHVAIDVFHRDGDRMEASESWGELQAEDTRIVESDMVGLVLRWRSFTPEVSRVVRDSPADTAGVRPGDILLSISNQSFADPLGLCALLNRIRPRERVGFVVERHGKELELELTTGRKPSRDELLDKEHVRLNDSELHDYQLELQNQLTSLRRIGPYEKRTPEELQQFDAVLRGRQDCVVEFRELGETLTLGTIMSSDGYILTKASELEDAIDPEVFLSDGRRLRIKEIAVDRAFDLMLVKVNVRNLKPVVWSNERAQPAGRIVITTDSRGTPLLPGVVSVATRRLNTSKKGFLGIRLGDDDSRAGITVAGILPGGAAERHGLRKGDRVLSINSSTVHSNQEISRRIAAFPTNAEIKLRIQRGGIIKTMDVILTPKFTDEAGDAMLGRYRNLDSHGKYANTHNAGFPEALQHDTDLYPNQCGGPLFDISGKAIGINIARAARITSYAVPVEAVKRVYRKLKEKGSRKRPRDIEREKVAS